MCSASQEICQGEGTRLIGLRRFWCLFGRSTSKLRYAQEILSIIIWRLTIYYNVGKSVSTDRPPDHPDGRLDWIQKRGTNLSPSPPRMNDGPRHGPPYISSVDLQGTHSRTDHEAGRCQRAVPSLLTRVPRSTA